MNSKAEFHGPAVRRRYVEGSELQCDKCDYKSKTVHMLTKHKQLKHNLTEYLTATHPSKNNKSENVLIPIPRNNDQSKHQHQTFGLIQISQQFEAHSLPDHS